ncbi:Aste57867_14325 [Aphanomyces stellatus]|uniref:Aste57867_14325 protein n=1 Tax=Aphanomyces stellatus TaxID=120398 RepID=A0A485L0X1_9STRA|nr:hypothetical protein As57867_014271 [Aphanomyces stellatus]VFT91149.1 Aste57867_14325 [Aphanomyces stellatus]
MSQNPPPHSKDMHFPIHTMVHTSPQGFWSHFYNGAVKPGALLDPTGVAITIDHLKPIVLVLFSAYWCPPCRALTPSLVQFGHDHVDDVSIVYVSRDYNSAMQQFNLRTKPTYNRYEWTAGNVELFNQLKAVYPSIMGIPTLFAVDRDSGNVLAERAAVSIRLRPETVISEWRAGRDISKEEENAWWNSTRGGDLPQVDLMPHLPWSSLVDASGNPVPFESLHDFIVLYFGAVWAQDDEALTPTLAAFATNHPDDVSVVYFSLDVDATGLDTILDGAESVLRFAWTEELATIAYNLDQVMTKDCDRNTLAAPRALVIEKESHKVLESYQYGFFIKPKSLVDAWKRGVSGVTDDEVGAYFEAKYAAQAKKNEEARKAKD